MNAELHEIAESLDTRLAELNQKETAIQTDLAKVQQEKSEAQAAIQRIQLLRSGQRQLVNYGCLDCYVFHDISTEMSQLESDTGTDLFRCRKCGYEMEIEP